MAANQTTLDLSVTGMSCGSCQRHVQHALAAVGGVQSATVDLAGGRATVAYQQGAVTPEQLIAAVEEAGYGAEVATTPAERITAPRSGS